MKQPQSEKRRPNTLVHFAPKKPTAAKYYQNLCDYLLFLLCAMAVNGYDKLYFLHLGLFLLHCYLLMLCHGRYKCTALIIQPSLFSKSAYYPVPYQDIADLFTCSCDDNNGQSDLTDKMSTSNEIFQSDRPRGPDIGRLTFSVVEKRNVYYVVFLHGIMGYHSMSWNKNFCNRNVVTFIWQNMSLRMQRSCMC